MIWLWTAALAAPCFVGVETHQALPEGLTQLVEAPRVQRLLPEVGERCWEPILAGEVRTASVVVEYADGVDPKLATWVAERAEEALATQVDTLGWRLPPGMPAHPLMIYLSAQQEGGGVTTTQDCEGEEVPFIAFTLDAFADAGWGVETIAHEVNHAIQHAYGDPQLWFWEATATWMQRQVVPEGTAWTYWLPAWADRPWMGMAASGQQVPTVLGHMFGMVVWPSYLSEHVGDPALIESLWVASEGLGPNVGQAELLAAVGLDLEEEHAPFLATLAARSWIQSDLMLPPVAQQVELLPARGEAAPDALPESYGASFVRLTGDALEAEELRFTVNGDPGVPWTVVVVTELGGASAWTRLGETGGVASSVVAVEPGATALWLVASPRSDLPRGGWPVSWRIEAVETVVPVEEPPESCGCSSRGGGALPWLLLGICGIRRRDGALGVGYAPPQPTGA